MHFISVVLLAIASNIDNFAVGLAYGSKKLKIGVLTNLFIALISGVGSFLSVSVGQDIRTHLSVDIAHRLGCLILVAFGAWCIWETLKRDRKKAKQRARRRQEIRFLVSAGSDMPPSRAYQRLADENDSQDFADEFLQEFSYENYLDNPEKADTDKSGYIDVRESIALAFGLTLNNLGSGIGGGMLGLNAMIISLLVFVLSGLGMLGGYFLGDRFSIKMSGWQAVLGSGGLIIATGLYEYFFFLK